MPTVSFVKNIPPLEVEAGAELMQSLLKAGLPVASSCLGDGICGKCRVIVIAGSENLSPITSGEQITSERLGITRPARLSCQARVHGDVTVDTTYW